MKQVKKGYSDKNKGGGVMKKLGNPSGKKPMGSKPKENTKRAKPENVGMRVKVRARAKKAASVMFA